MFYRREIREKIGVILLIISCFLFGILLFGTVSQKDSIVASYTEEDIKMEGRIYRIEKKYNDDEGGEKTCSYHITTNIISINGETIDCSEKSLVKIREENLSSSYENNLAIGDVIAVYGKVKLPQGRRNPNCFDYRLHLKSLGIDTVINADKLYIENDKKTLLGRLYINKERYLSELKEKTSDRTAALVRGMLFGEKYEIEEDVLKEFQKNGTAHILAVSGLHIGIIYGFISLLWVGEKRWIYLVFNLVFFSIYIVLANFSPSVIRAVIMVWLHLFSKLVNKKYDMASATYLVAMMMAMKNPYTIFNAGFQMSFLAVLTIGLLLPLFKRIYNGILVSSLTVQLGLLPYTSYMFNYISLVSVFINVPIIFLTSILLPLAMVSILILPVSNGCFNVVTELIDILCNAINFLNEKTSIDGVTVYEVPSLDLWKIVGIYMIVFGFLSEYGRLIMARRQMKKIIGIVMMIMIVSFAVDKFISDDFKNTDIVFVDVGQGDCIHFRTDGGKNYLIDGGGSINYNLGDKTLKQYLLKNGVGSIDGAFVTHLHTDHYKGIAELCRLGYVKKIYVYEGYRVREESILDETRLNKEDIVYLHSNQIISLEEAAMVEILWPEKKNETKYMQMALNETDENEMCLIIKLVLNDKTTIVTGDVDEKCQSDISDEYGDYLKCDILKVAHHGSKYSYSQDFLMSTKPKFSVIQVGKNNFGHPDANVVNNYIQHGSSLYRNDLSGAIGFRFTKEGDIKVKTVIKEE